MRYHRFILGLLFASLTACMHSGQPLEGAKRVFQAGDFKTAFRDMLPLAVEGDAQAEYAVGYMYYYGVGVPQDSESGLFWIKKSALAHNGTAATAMALIQDHPLPPTQHSASTTHYTLQLFGSYELAPAKQLQASVALHRKTHIAKTVHQGKDWYILTFGQYNTIDEAKSALHQLPLALANFKPWIRRQQE